MTCPICTWSPEDGAYRFLFETTFWRVVLAPNQSLVGRCVVSLKRHARDLADLTRDDLLDWLQVVQSLEGALHSAFGATMFNWSCYMNHAYREPVPEPHVHWWAVPRYDQPVAVGDWTFTDPDFGSPYDHGRWLDVPEDLHREIAERILQRIENRRKQEADDAGAGHRSFPNSLLSSPERRCAMQPRNSVERAIRGEVVVPASVAEVWQAWTTEEGAESFFAPRCHIDLRPGGAYEMLFDLGAEPGSQGGEGMVVMAIQPPRMLSFTWNAPPSLPEVRGQRTHVVVRLFETETGATRVSLRHDGWGEGGEWDTAFAYFSRAWNDVVLPRLKHRFEQGPMDWSDPPRLAVGQ